MAARLPVELPRFLARPDSEADVARRIAERRRTRAAAFLALARDAIWSRAGSPYLRLLEIAGVTRGHVEQWVARDGLDATLERLAASGVYVTFDEFKGKVPIERHGRTFRVHERDFDHPGLSAHYEVVSGGTRSRGTTVGLNLGFIEDIAVNTAFAYRAHGVLDAVHAIWAPSAGAAPMAVLAYLRLGVAFERWFSHWVELPLKYRVGTTWVRVIARACGRRVPSIEYVDLERAAHIARWMAGIVAGGRRPCLLTYASSALRVAEAAVAEGLSLDGARFVVLGEPFTEAKQRAIRASGAEAIVRFAFTEAGIIGYGCLAPETPDDLHPFTDAFAIARHRRTYRDVTVEPLLFTGLLPTAPKILLNVESGDTADSVDTPCGCAFAGAGYRARLRQIRSFEKFTGEGVSFVGIDVLRVLEEVLPAAFGGSATHYQVIEEEDADGHVALTLRVDPAIGRPDPARLVEVFLAGLAAGHDLTFKMTELWRQAGSLRVVYAPPLTTARGKLLPFHTRLTAPRSAEAGHA
jgi:hypothetical protein